MILKDSLNEDFTIGDRIAVSTSQGIRTGIVTKMNTNPSKTRCYSVQINRNMGDGTWKKQSFDYVPKRFLALVDTP